MGPFLKGVVLYWGPKKGPQFRELPMWHASAALLPSGLAPAAPTRRCADGRFLGSCDALRVPKLSLSLALSLSLSLFLFGFRVPKPQILHRSGNISDFCNFGCEAQG